MSGRLTQSQLLALYNPIYLTERQKADAKYNRYQHRYAISYDLETTTNTIYENIIEAAKRGEQSFTVNIIEEGGNTDVSGIYFNELYCNYRLDVSGNDIIDVLSNSILRISENNLYSISDLINPLISNMNIQGEIDVSGANVIVDASNNVLFKVVGTKVYDSNDTEIDAINEDKFSDKVLNNVNNMFEGMTGTIEQPIMQFSVEEGSSPPPKIMTFDWSGGDGELFHPNGNF
jgi:hypothetical protein